MSGKNILITSSRMPFALDEIRKFGQAGHSVYAADTFKTSPGSHSKAVKESLLTAQPRQETLKFLEDLKQIIQEKSIDLLIPMFEEVFYISKHLEEFTPLTSVFASPFDTLFRFHDKSQFLALCAELNIRAPRTTTATSLEELKSAVKEYDEYFARAVFSRGGVELLTNTGPLAGAVNIEECRPTAENPFLVQEFNHGLDMCSFSVAQHGRLALHCTYVHPKTIEHAGGIQFISVDEPETVSIVRSFVEATGYHGQISFDYMKDEKGLCMVECNPRPTDGCTLFPADVLVESILNENPGEPRVLEAGHEIQIDVAIIRDMVKDWRQIPSDIHDLLRVSDLYFQKHDIMPALYQFLSYSHVRAYRKFLHTGEHKRTDIMAAQIFDISWDGDPIP